MTAGRLLAAGSWQLPALLFATAPATAQVTTPEAFFGHQIGADYVLPDYDRFVGYWRRLATESDRMELVDIGRTAEGRTQYMAVVTSPENHRDLERYRGLSERLAIAKGLTDEQALALAREGKAVVWIDGGLHANEVLGPQQLLETVYQVVSRNDAETLRILDDVIILFVHANPDGMDLVSGWYMREPDPLKRSSDDLPRLYQKYVGHDNNRDFYMSTQPETENMNRVLYHVWFPQIVYNHHQRGPVGTIMFAPPFRDPFNYVIDPLLLAELDMVGGAMHARFLSEGKPGVTMRRGASYSTWWNGGLRTTVYFHNMIGLLTETVGHPTPIEIPFVPRRQLPHGDLLDPIEPQTWHFRRSVDYSVTANYAVLDFASRYRERLLDNIYEMGKNSIQRGSRDTWTRYPDRLKMVTAAMKGEAESAQETVMSSGAASAAPDARESRRLQALLEAPELRDPRGYILPADQRDFPTAVRFVNALLETGVTVHRATDEFSVAGERYPPGSFVVKTAQAFRPHVLDMFEPQDHPDDFLYPGGPPVPPYDVAGWTLAYQMGVEFDRILDDFSGPFVEIDAWNVEIPPGEVPSRPAAGYLLSAAYNDAYPAALRLLQAGVPVYRLKEPVRSGAGALPAGSYYVPASDEAGPVVEGVARTLGVDFEPARSRPAGEATLLRMPRVALWDRYGGSMTSGWTRWILEQFGIPFQVVYASDLNAGRLGERFDVIVFPSDARAIPPLKGRRDSGPDPERIPPEYRNRLPHVSVETTIPELRTFLQEGGSIVAIGTSTRIARHLELPIGDKLVDEDGDPLPREEFFIPGSVLQVQVDTTHPATAGLPERLDVFFDESPVFRLEEGAVAAGIRPLARFATAEPLRSGWAWGQEHLEGGIAAIHAPVGQGDLYLFGPEILFRAQAHGAFKLLFNSIAEAAGVERRVR